jgi:hypothetical protein
MGEGDNYQEYKDWATVECLIMANNSSQFCLTEDTPPMKEPLLSGLRYLADTETAEQILNGTYICPPGMDEYTRDFLQIMEHPNNIVPMTRLTPLLQLQIFRHIGRNQKSERPRLCQLSTLATTRQ